MPMTIRFRNIVKDENGAIVSGSATLVQNVYSPNAQGKHALNHSKRIVIERLGKVVWMSEDRKSGIFNSHERGLVAYDVSTDEFTPVSPQDPRLSGTKHEGLSPRIHTNFGNQYLFFSEMGKTPFMNVIRTAFPNQQLFQKILAHLAHDCLKNGSAVKCGEFLQQSALSYLLTDIPVSTLDCDSGYFAEMAKDNHKVDFFKALVTEMRKVNPEFGHACYVDSTPLPGEAENNPFNALSSHGTDGLLVQSRLVLVLDIETNIPVWYEIIPSNVLDKSTILSITQDVKITLDVDIDMFDLDAGYARRELFEMFNRNNATYTDDNGKTWDHTVLVRMPAIAGYPTEELYVECKPHFYNGRYQFDYEHHTFFGERVEIQLFDYPEYAYVFVDTTQAQDLLRKWRQDHWEQWVDLTDKEQDWFMVKDGFFTLIGNKDQTPREALIEYRGRTSIEGFFRDGKTYLKILPLAKWSKETVTGKIFHDIIETIFYREYRKQIAPTGLTMERLIVCMDSWECFKVSDAMLELKTPNLQTRQALERLGYAVPGHIDLNEMRQEFLQGIPMNREPLTVRSNRKAKQPEGPIAPEDKLQEKENRRIARINAEAEKVIARATAKADKAKETATAQAQKTLDRAMKKAHARLDKVVAAAKRQSTVDKARSRYDMEVSIAKDEFEQKKVRAEETWKQTVADATAEAERMKKEALAESK